MNVSTRALCLSPRRKAVLLALYTLARPKPWGLGYPPSVRDIQRAIGYRSSFGATYQLEMLAKAGLIYQIEPNTDRAWRPSKHLIFITQDGVTDVRERLDAARR